MPQVERAVLERSAHLFRLIQARRDLELLTDPAPGRYAGIVSFRSRRMPAEQLYERLRSEGVVCAKRGGGIRFSPHFYTPLEQLERVMAMTESA